MCVSEYLVVFFFIKCHDTGVFQKTFEFSMILDTENFITITITTILSFLCLRMSATLWPVTINQQIVNEPIINGHQCTVNGQNFVTFIEDNEPLWLYMKQNYAQLQPALQTYMKNISEPFIPKLPIGTICRIKLPSNEWQALEENRYARLELIHCANTDYDILPFHDVETQYGFFFMDISM